LNQTFCPLCYATHPKTFHAGEKRIYLHCPKCDLVFVPSRFFVTKEEEKAKYDNHRNTPENRGYCNFLNRLIQPLEKELSIGAKGLDFGSGPGPTLSVLMERKGYEMEIYDPFYAPDRSVFEKRYDFITATEVIEHLHHPAEELQRLYETLYPGGILGIMTAFRPQKELFGEWYYKRDLTHIRFFSPRTFRWIADFLKAKLTIPQSGVVLLKKPKSP